MSSSIEKIALALGGNAGSRLAWQLGILASAATLLRQLRRMAWADPAQGPRVLGIDDWAWRKRHHYGTILCDLEQGKVIDLLQAGKPPALPGRQSKFDNSGRPSKKLQS